MKMDVLGMKIVVKASKKGLECFMSLVRMLWIDIMERTIEIFSNIVLK